MRRNLTSDLPVIVLFLACTPEKIVSCSFSLLEIFIFIGVFFYSFLRSTKNSMATHYSLFTARQLRELSVDIKVF